MAILEYPVRQLEQMEKVWFTSMTPVRNSGTMRNLHPVPPASRSRGSWLLHVVAHYVEQITVV